MEESRSIIGLPARLSPLGPYLLTPSGNTVHPGTPLEILLPPRPRRRRRCRPLFVDISCSTNKRDDYRTCFLERPEETGVDPDPH